MIRNPKLQGAFIPYEDAVSMCNHFKIETTPLEALLDAGELVDTAKGLLSRGIGSGPARAAFACSPGAPEQCHNYHLF